MTRGMEASKRRTIGSGRGSRAALSGAAKATSFLPYHFESHPLMDS